MKKLLSFIIIPALFLPVALSNNIVKSTAAELSTNMIALDNEKYMVVNSVEDADAMYQYIEKWDSEGEDLTSSNYSHKLKFVTKSNVTDEQIKSILSKYDTNYLFSFKITHEFTIQNLRTFFANVGYESKNKSWCFLDRYHQFGEGAKDYVNLIGRLLDSKNADLFVTGLNGMDYDSYEFKINTPAAQFNYCNEESEYMIRFNSKEDLVSAKSELDSLEGVTITYSKTYKDNVDFEPEITLKEYNGLIRASDLDAEQARKWYYSYFGAPKDGEYIPSDEYLISQYEQAYIPILTKTPKGISCFVKPYVDDTRSDTSRWDNFRGHFDRIDGTTIFCALTTRAGDDALNYSSLRAYIPEFVEEICGGKIIYRLYNLNTGEHLFTSSRAEHDKLAVIPNVVGNGWVSEGASCIINDEDMDESMGVYRIYNPNVKGGDHHYTKSKAEAEKRVKDGWKWDFGGKPVFYVGGDVDVYRLYNKNDGRHHYTPKLGEKNSLVKKGWKFEGTGWHASKAFTN